MPRVAILDNLGVAQSIAYALRSTYQIETAGVAATLDDLQVLIRQEIPNVVIVDIGLDNAGDRTAVCALDEVRSNDIPVLYLSRQGELSLLKAVQRAGAAGFILKSNSLEAIARAVVLVAEGGSVFDGRFASHLREGIQSPTDREVELIRLLARGSSNATGAHTLNISPRTVESHLRRLFVRYDVSSRSQLLMLALREGWISLDETENDEQPVQEASA